MLNYYASITMYRKDRTHNDLDNAALDKLPVKIVNFPFPVCDPGRKFYENLIICSVLSLTSFAFN